MLKLPDVQKKYQEHLSLKILEPRSTESVEQNWDALKCRIQDSAAAVLVKPSFIPPNRQCRKAFAEVKRFLFWVNRSAQPKWRHKLAEARELLQKNIREYEEK